MSSFRCRKYFQSVWRKWLQNICLVYQPHQREKDGLSKVFEWYIGDIVCSKRKMKIMQKFNLLIVIFKMKSIIKKFNFRKEPCMPKMINNICEYLPRTELIIELTLKYRKEGRNVLILTDRRGHLELIYKMLEGKSRGFYVGGMKPDQLRESQEKGVILATFSMASQACRIYLN